MFLNYFKNPGDFLLLAANILFVYIIKNERTKKNRQTHLPSLHTSTSGALSAVMRTERDNKPNSTACQESRR